TEWHVAFSRPLTCKCHRQCPRDGTDACWATSAWTVLESCAAVDQEAGDPAANCGATDSLLLGQTARPYSGSTAQDQTRTPHQALCGGASAHPALQLTLLRGSQVDPRRGTRHRHTPSFGSSGPPYPASVCGRKRVASRPRATHLPVARAQRAWHTAEHAASQAPSRRLLAPGTPAE